MLRVGLEAGTVAAVESLSRFDQAVRGLGFAQRKVESRVANFLVLHDGELVGPVEVRFNSLRLFRAE